MRSRYMVLAVTCIVLACIVVLILVLEDSPPTSVVQEPTSSLNNTSIGDLGSEFMGLLGRVEKLRWEGYDVAYIDYLLLSARYSYLRGDKSKAIELLEEAEKLLENTSRLPELPRIEFDIRDNSLDLKKIPTRWDFVPLGTVFVLSNRGYLAYPGNDLGWKLSCFIIIAWGHGENEWFAYQGRLPLIAWEGVFRPRVFLGSEWRVLDMVFAGPLYYDDGSGVFKYPTVYEYDLSGKFMEYITYIPFNRTWIHGIVDTQNNKTILLIRAHAIGTPMWLGTWNKTYLVHGVYSDSRGLDLWAGFWDFGLATIELSVDGRHLEYKGVFVFDRASHHVYDVGDLHERLGLPLAFSCMVIYQEGLNIMVSMSTNPSPWDPGYPFEHQLRVNLLDENKTIDTVNFTLIDDGLVQPRTFTIYGVFDNGYINITGHVLVYWPPMWPRGHRTWWDSRCEYSWGRAFTQWTGELVVDGKTIEINALGAGEYTRYNPTSNCTSCNSNQNNEGCWCNWPIKP